MRVDRVMVRDDRRSGEPAAPRPIAIVAAMLAVLGAAVLGSFLSDAAGAAVGALAWGLGAILLCALALVALAQRERIARAAREAQALALTDPLTGLPNRRGFEERAGAALSRMRRRGESFTLLRLDLDDFARVNEELGHAHGDELLRSIAFEALSVLRGEDIMARLEGDNFAVLLPDSSEEEERRLVARVVAAVERAVPAVGPLVRVTASAGTACYPRDGASIADLLAAAEGSLTDVRSERDEAGHRLEMALVPEDAIDDCEERLEESGRDGWPVRRPLALGGGLAVALLAAWFGLAGWIDPDVLRPALTGLATCAGVLACLAAARAACGRERYGWALIAAGLATWFLPLAGPLAGAAGAAGLLVVLSGRWLSDRYRLLDVVGVGLSVTAFTVALLVPRLVELSSSQPEILASRISVGILGAALVTAAVVVSYWVPARARPDAMLVALGYLVAVAATAPWAMGDSGWVFTPSAAGEVALALAIALIAAGALIRAERATAPSLEAGDLESRTLDGSIAGNLLLVAVVAGILVHGGSIDAAVVVGLLLGVIVVRDIRSRLLERDRRELRRSAVRSRRELALQWKANLVALSRALTARDGYTGEHSVATVDLAVKVARRLGLSREAVREVEIAALLHDVGKIGVPDDVLRAPRSLDEDEWRLMREHPVIGERILRAVPGLEQVARSVRHEHERWDGTGYPDRLAGQDIPLPSRIVLACDAFDAICSDRPYRPARTRHEAMAELQRGSGTQFDPAVVHALLDELLATEQATAMRRGRFARRERPPARTAAERAV